MTRRSRSTLKHFFRHGALPSADQFADFIDSTVNQVEDGFDKTPEKGIKISSRGGFDSLISFFREGTFRDDDPDEPVWTIGYDGKQDKLLFKKKVDQADDASSVLCLSRDGKVGINRKDPGYALDVKGVVRSTGRIGLPRDDELRVKADGEWHDITEPLTGCYAFEVMAGVGKKQSGKYALMHAIAMNAQNPSGILFDFFRRKSGIRCNHAYYSDRCSKLQLRWKTDKKNDRKYRLQIRSRCGYFGKGHEEVFVSYFLTELWFDPLMKACTRTTGGKDGSGGSGA